MSDKKVLARLSIRKHLSVSDTEPNQSEQVGIMALLRAEQ